eukprot:5387710-Prymnesium_polylepis.1
MEGRKCVRRAADVHTAARCYTTMSVPCGAGACHPRSPAAAAARPTACVCSGGVPYRCPSPI